MNLNTVEAELKALYRDVLNINFRSKQIADRVAESYRDSAINLIQYLVMRRRELRKVHDFLSDRGVSSLRSSEGYVFRNLSDVLTAIRAMQGEIWEPHEAVSAIGYKDSKRLIKLHVTALLGAVQKPSKTHIIMNATSKLLPKVHEMLLHEGVQVIHYDVLRCGYESTNKSIQRVRNEVKVKKDVTTIVSLQGRRILIDTRALLDKEGLPYKRRLTLQPGDHLVIDNTMRVGQLPQYGEQQQLIKSAVVPTVLRDTPLVLNPGDVILLANGNVEARVLSSELERVRVVVTRCDGGKAKLQRYTEVWLPGSSTGILSPADRRNLPDILQSADVLCIDGIDHPSKIADLRAEIEAASTGLLWSGRLLLRVDSDAVVEHLPMTILTAMQHFQIGLWLDSDRLLSDVGPERLGELQDQIAWIAEAGHIPLVLGSEILQSVNANGRVSRAEVTEAVQAMRAEAVVISHDRCAPNRLNLLRDIMRRTEKHYSKKKPTMRALKVAAKNLDMLPEVFVD